MARTNPRTRVANAAANVGSNRRPARDPRAIVDDQPLVNKAEGGDEDEGDHEYDEEDEEEDDNGGDEGEQAEESKKGDVDVGDLRKAMNDLEAGAKIVASGGNARSVALAAKLAKGDALTDEESAELRKSLDAPKPADRQPLRETLREDPAIGVPVDASDFLDALLTKSCDAIDALRDTVLAKSEGSDTFAAQLAKGFVQLGRTVATLAEENALLKSDLAEIKDALGVISEQPRAPKGSTRRAAERGGDRMNKGGDGGNNVQLGPEKIMSTLEDMLAKSEYPHGIDGTVEIAKFESTGIVREDVMAKVAEKNGIQLPARRAN